MQSIGFNKYLPVGDPRVCVEFLSKWGIDEIVVLDISATPKRQKPDFALVKEISKRIFVPLTVGGGIKTLEDMRELLHCGADKISINAIALENPRIIREAALVFGNQCIVVSLDVKKNKNGKYEIFSDSGGVPTGLDVVSFAKKVEDLGAGEILINSIDRDGSKSGYDVTLVSMVCAAVRIPVIACGGVGLPRHFLEGFEKGGASATAAGNFFHFTEHSPILVKSYLAQKKMDVRLDTYADYQDINFDQKTGRIIKRGEQYLDKLRFEYLPEEVI